MAGCPKCGKTTVRAVGIWCPYRRQRVDHTQLLYPINDKEVRSALQTHKSHIGPLHEALQEEKLRGFLVDARQAAALPPAITELRVLDVLVWMRGT